MNEMNRPCEEYLERIALMTSGDLSEDELPAVMRHLSECGGCRAYWQALQNDHHALTTLSRSHQGRIQSLEDGVIGSIMGEERVTAGGHRWWRWIMQTRSGRITAGGAAAAIAVFLIIFIHGTTTPFMAWADVLEKVRNATSCRYRARNLDSQRTEAVRIFSDLGFDTKTYEDGELVEGMAIDFSAKTVVHYIPPLKCGVRMKLGDEMMESYVAKDPMKIFSTVSGVEHEEIGTRQIDGRKAVGIRARSTKAIPELMDEAVFEIWADPKTQWPIRIDVRGTSADGAITKRVRFYDFEWNVPVTEADFRPDIPDDYEIVTGPEFEISEEHTIAALENYARVAERYPSTLAYEQLTREMWGLMGMRVLSTEVLPVVHQLRAACGFYGKLVQNDRDVLYFGDRVRPGDAERVLMRWKIGDDRFRVIFGDLGADTVSGARLLEMESH
jgi:hypothetical protein